MTHRLRNRSLLFPLAVFLLSACAGRPSLSVDTPAEGGALGPALDLDVNLAGLQIEVTGKTSAAAWSRVTAFAGAELAETTVQDGAFTFPSVTLPDGNPTLLVYVVDKDTNKSARLDRKLTVDSLAHGCVFVSPDEGAVVRTDPGDSGLVELPVRVRCAGLLPTEAITVKASDTELAQQQFPAFDGTATFPVTLLPGLNLIELLAPGIPMSILRVTLDVRRCRVLLSPLPGAIFNLTGNLPDSVADANPTGPGIQAHVVAHTDCGDGVSARLAVTRVGAQTVTVSSTTQGGAAQFDLTLPDGPLLAQAFVGDPGATGASRRAAWSADSLQPTVRLISPGTGELLTDAEDAVPELEGLQVRIAGKVTGLDAGGWALLELDVGSMLGGRVLPLTVNSSGDFSELVTLENGQHAMRAHVQRTSGNEAFTSRIPFETFSQGGASVTIVSPRDGDALGLDLLLPQPGGAQALFSVHTVRAPGARVTVKCGAAQGEATVDANGDTQVPVVLPLAGCARQNVSCLALATSAAGTLSSAPVTLAVDDSAPTVTLSSPVNGATRTAQADVLATTSCPGELQSWSLTVNGAQIGHGLLTSNALSVQGIALQPGENAFSLTVADEVQNQSAPAVATVTLLTGTPQVFITAPANGATLGAADDLDADLADGLQLAVSVQVDNRPLGTQVQLTVTGSGISQAALTAATQTSAGHLLATFALVTVPEGPVTLLASVTDPVTPPAPPQTATLNVTVATGRALCAIADPLDGAVWSAADDTVPGSPGVQHDVKVRTSGDGALTLTLTPPSGSPFTSAQSAPPGTGLRTATFPAQTFAQEGLYTLDATCAQTSGSMGRAVQSRLSLALGGPALSFESPPAGAMLPATAFDADGNTSVVVRAMGAGATGGTVSLTFECGGSGATTLGPSAIPAGGLVTFAVPLVLANEEADCQLTASGESAQGLPGLLTSIAVRADRSVPAPSFITPLDGAQYGPSAPELDCRTPSLPTLRTVDLALTDPLEASGLVLVVTASGTPTTLSQAPTAIEGGWRYSNVTLANGPNALSVTATDATGNQGSVQVSLAARCTSGDVTLDLVVSGNSLGYAQDKDHGAVGLQLGAQVTSSLSLGSPVRVCSTLGDPGLGSCAHAGTYPVATTPSSLVLSGGPVSFDLTLADGLQELHAEVSDVAGAALSSFRTVTVRASPPRVLTLTLPNDTNADGALNQGEMNASSTLQFQVSFAAGAAINGQPVQLFSQSISSALGSTIASGNGPIVVPVDVPLTAVTGTGGLQTHVFYVRTVDDAGNVNSIPGAEYPGDPAATLGTNISPFVIAPAPALTLTRPTSAVTSLLAADDTRCSGGVCPGIDPLSYALSATTNAADEGTTVTFLLDDATLGAGVVPSAGEATAFRALLNGPTRKLKAHVVDRYGNGIDSTERTLAIDSIPPALIFNGQPTPPNAFPQTLTVDTGTSLEAGQVISVTSDLDGLVGFAPATGTATNLRVSLATFGTHRLTATAHDAAGNLGTSAQLTVDQGYTGPTLALTQPTPRPGTVYFGLTTLNGGRCAPPLKAAAGNTADGVPVTLWVAATNTCAGPPSGGVEVNVVAGVADFTGLVRFANGDSGYLCAEVTVVPGQTVHTDPQAFACDLDTPHVTFVTPTADQLFVARTPQVPPGALQNQGMDPGSLVADYALTVTAPAQSTVELFADGAGTAFASTTLASPAAGATVSFTAVPLAILPALPLTHALMAKVTAPSGNTATPATRSVQIDIAPPAQVTPALTQSSLLSGKVHVDAGALPGDDGTTGVGPMPLSWDVRYSLTTPLTIANWFSAGTLMTGVPMPPATAFDLVFPTDQGHIWFGVRAVDRVGNLGGFTDQTAGAPTLVTALTRTSTSVGPPNGLPSGAVPVSPALRVGDFDGDGFDDVAIAYPYDDAGKPQDCASGYCDGTIRVYFGSAAGLDSVPLVLTGSIPGGALGFGQSFDVGDFDGDGKADIVAGETDFFSAFVHVWTGTALAAARPSHGTPAPITLSDTGANHLLGGTVRAVGRPTPGPSPGDDLAISNYTPGSGQTTGLLLAVLPRQGAWLAGSALALTTHSAFSIILPSTDATPPSPTAGNGQTDVAPLGDLDASATMGLFVSFVETQGTNPNETSLVQDLRAYPGGALVPLSLVPQSAGTVLRQPATGLSLRWGFSVAGGRDAAADAMPDLLVADLDRKRVNLYDGSSLLSGTSQPLTVLDLDAEPDADVGACALFLPDLDGNGKAEFTGCASAGRSSAAYLGFGFSGTTPPVFSFFAPNPPGWTFTPKHGQKVLPNGGVFGQAVAVGHFESQDPSALEVLVLSHNVPVATQEKLWLVR